MVDQKPDKHSSIFNIFAKTELEPVEQDEEQYLNDDIFEPNYEQEYVKKFKFSPILGFSDVLICIFLVNGCVVACWRGLWIILDMQLEPYGYITPYIISLLLQLILYASQNSIIRLFKSRESLCRKITKRIYVIIFAVLCVLQWRSLWFFFDYITDLETDENYMPKLSSKKPAISYWILCIICMLMTKTLCSIKSPPFLIALDSKEETFLVPLMYKSSASDKTILYILDCLFSILVIGTLVVFVWRGGWVILDLFVYPEDFTKSSWVTLILGYILVAVAFLMQPLMKWICENISGTARLIVADLFLLFTFFATINTWRGIWNLLNIYFLPDNLELSCWITYWVCLVLLILLGCSNSLLVRGVYIDAEEPGGECVVFPCHYLRNILANQRRKKILANIKLGTEHKLKNVKIITVKENHNANVGKSQQKNEIANHKENQ